MIPLESITVFFVASVALALAPGPDNIYVLTQSAIQGRAAGLFVTLGLCTGLLFHTAAVVLGVAALFAASAVAFNVLKYIGAAYLLYLAWQAFRAGTSDLLENRDKAIPSHHLYARGVVMNITNPKVAIFFLAFLPQFADPARGSLSLQLALFGAIFIVAALLVFGLIAWFAGFLGERLGQSRRAQIILNRIAGTIFAGLALRLVTAQR
jgi:threonine/homoserine/homoserine lactone efflux protein